MCFRLLIGRSAHRVDEARGDRRRHRVARVPIGAWIGRRGEIRARREAWYGRRSSTTHTYRHLCCARLLAVLITRCGAVLRSGEHRGRERDQGKRARATSRSTTCDTTHTRVRFRNHGSLDPSHGHGESLYSWLRGSARRSRYGRVLLWSDDGRARLFRGMRDLE